MKIAEGILDELEDKNYINKEEIELFCNNSSLGRWT